MVGITVFHPLSQWRQRLETRNPEIRLPSSVDVIETSCRREREIRHRLQAAAAEPLKPNVAGGEEPPAIGRLPSTPLLLDGGPVVDSAAAAPPQGEAVGRGGDRRQPQRLAAAAYLARAGRSVAVLERRGVLGGAAVSESDLVPGFRFSRCSYLLSLLRPALIQYPQYPPKYYLSISSPTALCSYAFL